jgi:hypothetical protein
MSRSDFWSIAATLIVAGVAYFVGGKISAYGCIGLGMCIALYLLATHKKERPQPSVSMTANPYQDAKQEANPKMVRKSLSITIRQKNLPFLLSSQSLSRHITCICNLAGWRS